MDMSRAMKLLDEARELCASVDGSRRVNPTDEPNSKIRASKNAEISRTLLYGAHVADLARAEILNSYHSFKGEENVPTINPD
jgi:hypothetical protein